MTKLNAIRKVPRLASGIVPAGLPIPGNGVAVWSDRCQMIGSFGNNGGPGETGHMRRGSAVVEGGNVARMDGWVAWYPYTTNPLAVDSFVVASGAWWSPALSLAVPSDAIITPIDGTGNLKNASAIPMGSSYQNNSAAVYNAY